MKKLLICVELFYSSFEKLVVAKCVRTSQKFCLAVEIYWNSFDEKLFMKPKMLRLIICSFGHCPHNLFLVKHFEAEKQISSTLASPFQSFNINRDFVCCQKHVSFHILSNGFDVVAIPMNDMLRVFVKFNILRFNYLVCAANTQTAMKAEEMRSHYEWSRNVITVINEKREHS